jgi:hypothetical protein
MKILRSTKKIPRESNGIKFGEGEQGWRAEEQGRFAGLGNMGEAFDRIFGLKPLKQAINKNSGPPLGGPETRDEEMGHRQQTNKLAGGNYLASRTERHEESSSLCIQAQYLEAGTPPGEARYSLENRKVVGWASRLRKGSCRYLESWDGPVNIAKTARGSRH